MYTNITSIYVDIAIRSMFAKAAAPLQDLINAKRHSDVKDYTTKHKILRTLLEQYPDDFFIDSENNNILGLTWKPKNFKIHAPRHVVPANIVNTAQSTPNVN
jgi:hypothetical protein